MDGKLWTRLYRVIRRECKPLVNRRRMGRPREYGTDDVLAVFAFAALTDQAVSKAREKLQSRAIRWWLGRYWVVPRQVPSDSTLSRRSKASDFRWLLRRVLRRLRHALGVPAGGHVVLDATLLLTGAYSRDPESRWTCHGGKWFRGYALHAVCDLQGRLLAWHVTSANVQEMKVARRLVRQIGAQGQAVSLVIADSGYDSEPLHQLVRRRLQAQLLAPLNLRGAKRQTWRTRQPGRVAAERLMQTRQGQAWFNQRSTIERWNSWFKGQSRLSMLPQHARRLRRVRRWVDLKLAVFFVHQYLLQQDVNRAA
jgi:transposase